MGERSLTSRYQLIDKIGEGGMALVYRGLDTLLHREVAIKVLREQYASDEQFVERFQREAQAAASLSHANVVNIYDVGEALGTHFIVMEYVHGRSLRRVIQEEGQLTPARAARYALQICDALQAAHDHGLVHRDIKPHNILITPDDRVKVTDFGIARAASSSTLTQTGIIIGSVHYFSPEQAKGVNAGPQSDLYSLGVVLYEMLTGEVPFSGESPIAVALKQIEEPAPLVTVKRPDCPPALVRIVERALAKDTGARFRDASQMASDLRRFLWTVEPERPEEADEYATRMLSAAEWQTATAARERSARHRKKPGPWLWVALVAVVLAAAAGSVPFLRGWFVVPEVPVPDLTGKPVEEARRMLADRRLTLEIAGRAFHDQIPVDHVITQDPLPSRSIKVDRSVRVTVSKGPELVSVPDLTGQDLRQAEVTLSQAGLQLGERTDGFSAEIQPGFIMSQDPPPFGRLEKGLRVNVVISRGMPTGGTLMPDLVGMAYEDATALVSSLGLTVGRVIQEVRPANAFRPGTVLDQNPAPETPVSAGTSVDLVVSRTAGQEATLPGTGRVKRATVTVTVPPGPPEQVVAITVIDAQGAREVYRQSHAPGDRVVRQVQGVGDRLKVRVYLDGVLAKEETVE